MEISVQICSNNRKALLKNCLEAIFAQDFPPENYEIVLVDDGSTDGTGDMVKSLSAPVKLLYLYQEQKGLATARNLGIQNSLGRYILFIDDDILSDPRLLKEHLSFHQRFPKSVVRGRVNHISDLKQTAHSPRFTLADISTSFFWTSNVSVLKKYLLEAGLFDQSFTEYGWEDLELGIRLKKLGLSCRYNKKALVFHFKHQLTKQELDKKIEQAKAKARTALLFLQKHPTLKVKLATGIHFPRLLWDSILNLGGFSEKLCRQIVQNSKNGRLRGLALFSARQLLDFTYFKVIKESLKKAR